MERTSSPSNSLRSVIIVGACVLSLTAALALTNDYRERSERRASAVAMTKGDPARAPMIFRRYGCTGCHTIPGIEGADGKVGGDLNGLRERVYIAGVLNNSADNLVDWIVAPQTHSPKTAMPPTGISEQEARDLAAYLYAR
ncbi:MULTISPECIES: c-type cytochrome [unclassified Rhizobium]|uniref:c-type cytochrome n=1 Tax=unclassified Rhizobium TaxID=2613769 RepID=UPI0007E9EB2E|nr:MULTISPECIES: c-type cytochrome [unclassified Rhizobium]ANM13219.1 cytochrome-c class 1 protein [Rhizobium sp. N324]ANM19617.1 cytochrome-c class 1 protein [Rhizobium sp. N541]ANM26002.1 cytochrome-c class 1 protein [Rhizobium sp. N941]OYD01012.1 cytochrome-c class 1 protein [Rhizobium sp. N4311]